jgi:methylglyoxal synthase
MNSNTQTPTLVPVHPQKSFSKGSKYSVCSSTQQVSEQITVEQDEHIQADNCGNSAAAAQQPKQQEQQEQPATSQSIRTLSSHKQQNIASKLAFGLARTRLKTRLETRLVALVAHNNMKPSMLQFVSENQAFFQRVSIVTTGSTGTSLENALGLCVARKVASGPLGGDQEIGGMIANGTVAAAFFFIDPLSSHPHASDIRALHNIACATNPWTGLAIVHAFNNNEQYNKSLSLQFEIQDSDVVKQYKLNQKAVIAAAGKTAFADTAAAIVTNVVEVGACVLLKGNEGRAFRAKITNLCDNIVTVQYETGSFKNFTLDQFNTLLPTRVKVRGIAGSRFEGHTFWVFVLENDGETVKVQYETGGCKRLSLRTFKDLLVNADSTWWEGRPSGWPKWPSIQ